MSEPPSNMANKESETMYNFNEFRNVPYLPEKLMRAVIEFVLKSSKLHTIIIDSVKINPDSLPGLGEALSASSSGILLILIWHLFLHGIYIYMVFILIWYLLC